LILEHSQLLQLQEAVTDARIANILSADLDKVTQLKPGDEISFFI